MTGNENGLWLNLETLGGIERDLPLFLSRLLDGDATERKRAHGVLYCEVANQGHLYSAAVACVDVIAQRVDSGRPISAEALSLLESILNARTPGLRVVVGEEEVDATEYCRERILSVLPALLTAAEADDIEWFRELCFLLPQLADASGEVIPFLNSCFLSASGERRKICEEALEEAGEVAAEGHFQ